MILAPVREPQESNMDATTLLIILIVLLVLGGGGCVGPAALVLS